MSNLTEDLKLISGLKKLAPIIKTIYNIIFMFVHYLSSVRSVSEQALQLFEYLDDGKRRMYLYSVDISGQHHVTFYDPENYMCPTSPIFIEKIYKELQTKRTKSIGVIVDINCLDHDRTCPEFTNTVLRPVFIDTVRIY
jgi:uncharacterized membrane protein